MYTRQALTLFGNTCGMTHRFSFRLIGALKVK